MKNVNLVIKRKDFKSDIEYLELLSEFYLKSLNINKKFIYFINRV